MLQIWSNFVAVTLWTQPVTKASGTVCPGGIEVNDGRSQGVVADVITPSTHCLKFLAVASASAPTKYKNYTLTF